MGKFWTANDPPTKNYVNFTEIDCDVTNGVINLKAIF